MSDIVVIGGGAAGMMAAIAAAGAHTGKKNNVILIEKNEKLGKKIFITGKGRCNVTNACEIQELFANVMEHSRFLYSAVYGFDNQAVMCFFENAGCPLKIERGQRVFPVSDHSSDIIKVLEQELRKLNVQIYLNTEVKNIRTVQFDNHSESHAAGEDGGAGKDQCEKFHRKKAGKKKNTCTMRIASAELFNKVTGKWAEINADSMIVATGGCSYVLTGSTGDGYRFAESCGHGIVPTMPSLVPFSIEESWCHELQGLSLRNVRASVEVDGKQIYSDFGEMLFTHYGVSGPLMLSASSHYVHKVCGDRGKKARIFIDLKPALTYEQLDRRVLREFDSNKNKQFKNAIGSLFPTKLIPVIPVLAKIDPDKKVNEITKEERGRFVSIIKRMELTITGLRGFDEAIITKGGVAINEISPSTMESKLVKGLYFAGEVLDLDALTGGFNLQIAWSTGYLAGLSAAASFE
ncbi:MAG: NAD(P)/FAD-dependent oxidoreductase [Lachnospiraceae bacterium]|nr:NAD(P)/FAD-dependent oxidoreductase [Lachnospiraceae bacterium]